MRTRGRACALGLTKKTPGIPQFFQTIRNRSQKVKTAETIIEFTHGKPVPNKSRNIVEIGNALGTRVSKVVNWLFQKISTVKDRVAKVTKPSAIS